MFHLRLSRLNYPRGPKRFNRRRGVRIRLMKSTIRVGLRTSEKYSVLNRASQHHRTWAGTICTITTRTNRCISNRQSNR